MNLRTCTCIYYVQLTSVELCLDSYQELILGEVFFPSTYSVENVELDPTANMKVANTFHLKHTTLHCELNVYIQVIKNIS